MVARRPDFKRESTSFRMIERSKQTNLRTVRVKLDGGAGRDNARGRISTPPYGCQARGVRTGHIGDRCPGTSVTLLRPPVGGAAMPGKQTNPVLERHHLARGLESGQWTMTELCPRYGIRRNAGCKWLDRYRHEGPRGLLDRTRAPRSIPHPTPPDVAALILEEHRRSGWGARKILKRLRTRDSTRAWPAGSTIFDILARQRQRRPLRLDRHPRPQPPQRLLAPARHQPPAHHPRQPAGERRARTAPQGPRGASRATARGEPQPPTARLQPVPEDLQRAAAPPQP